ncbi:MAG: PDZ domain-containing protein [Alphaproteobacteria bacterium]
MRAPGDERDLLARGGQAGAVIPADAAGAHDRDLHHPFSVAQVVPGSAAERAGLEVGDVIVAVGGDEVRNGAELRNKIGLLRVGEKVRLEILRKGKRRSVELVIRKAAENR